MGILDMLFPGTNTTSWASPLGLPPVVKPNPFVSGIQSIFQNASPSLVSAGDALLGTGNDPGQIAKNLGSPFTQESAALTQQNNARQAQNQTIKWLQDHAYNDLVPMALSGDVTGAYNAALQRQQGASVANLFGSLGASPQMQDVARTGGVTPSEGLNLALPQPISGYSSGTMNRLTGQSSAYGMGGGDPVQGAIQLITSGNASPTEVLAKLPRQQAAAVLAGLNAQGFDVAGADLNYRAAGKNVDTLNGVSFTRLKTSIDTTAKSLDIIDNLADQWRNLKLPGGTSLPVLNGANLAAAKQGAYGPLAMSVATQLEGQIHDSAAEIGSVFRNGNTPTDQAMQQASTQLDSSWSTDTLHDMTNMIRLNMQKRLQSFNDAGVNQNNPFMNNTAQTAQLLRQINGVTYTSPDGGKTWYTQ